MRQQTIRHEENLSRPRTPAKIFLRQTSAGLRVSGAVLCLLCVVYMAYVSAAERAAEGLRASDAKAVIIAGVISVTEGEVVRADDGCTIIRYYHEWDGTDYKRVIPRVNADYPVNTRLPVVYSLGMGIGSCLAVGFYRKTMLLIGVTGVILLILGMGLNFRKKGIG